MSESDDHLLFALSSRGSVSLHGFKEIYRALQLRQIGEFDAQREDLGYSLLNCVRSLQSLGHCDFDFSQSAVYIAQPSLVRLPRGGKAVAALVGARTPLLVDQLREEADRQDVRIACESGAPFGTGVPRRILAFSSSPSALADVAQTLGIEFNAQPASWRLANFCGSVADYVEKLDWLPATPPVWEDAGFHPARLSFSGFYDGEDRLRLSRQELHGRWSHALWRGEMRAEANLDWGRYAVASWRRRQLLAYDPRQSQLFCASSTPMPMPMARALALCSGQPPKKVVLRTFNASPDLHQRRCDCYAAVPVSIAELAFQRLGQSHKHISASEGVL